MTKKEWLSEKVMVDEWGRPPSLADVPMTIMTRKPAATFIHIPKSAGNSVRDWLLTNVATSRAMFKKSYMKDHAPYSYIKKAKKNVDHGLVFAIVRNPWDRVLSAYHYHRGKDRYGNDIDFDTFVKTHMRAANRPQHEYVDDSVLILKLENITEDFKQIQEYFNVYKPLPIKNASQHGHYTEYYTDETRKIVADCFNIDIETYKYKYE